MPKFHVYADRVQTQQFTIEAVDYEEAKRLTLLRLAWPAGPDDTEWSYDIDEVI